MANLVTLSRVVLLYLVIWIAFQPSSWWQLTGVPILILVFVTDGLDGWLARKRGETSLFGALFDIASDRIVEMSMWVALAVLGMVPIWVPLVFVARGSFVDAIRGSRSATEGIAPFALTERAWAQWLVAGKFMRSFYAVMKAHAFCWLLLIKPLPDLAPGFWSEWGRLLQLIGAGFVWIAVILCIARGLPVIIEFLVNHSRREQAARSC